MEQAPPTLFSFLYDHDALTIFHAAFLVFLYAMLFRVVTRGELREQIRDCALILIVSLVPRVIFWKQNVMRPAHFFVNLNFVETGDFYNFAYPGSFTALLRMLSFIPGVDSVDPVSLSFAALLVLGTLTPVAFYLLAWRIVPDRRLALTLAVMLALNPAHVLLTGHYDLFVPSMLFEVLSHFFLLLFLQTDRISTLIGFVLSSFLFYQSRTENNVILYLHAVVLAVALWRSKQSRVALAGCTLVYLVFNAAFQIDYFYSGSHNVHVVQNLPMAPLRIFKVLFDRSWNHFLDYTLCPPYIPLLMVAGLYFVIRERSKIYLYSLLVLSIFMLLYHDLPQKIPVGTARYFMNLMPAAFLLMLAALKPLFARWPKAFPATLVAVSAIFLAYTPRLANFEYAQQYEWDFYREKVRPKLRTWQTVWKYRMDPATYTSRIRASTYMDSLLPGQDTPEELAMRLEGLNIEFEDWHLFGMDGIPLEMRIVVREQDIVPESLVYLGLNCYQFGLGDGPMEPECQAQLDDPRNTVIVSAEYPVKVFHQDGPWYVTGAYKKLSKLTFYLLRRKTS